MNELEQFDHATKSLHSAWVGFQTAAILMVPERHKDTVGSLLNRAGESLVELVRLIKALTPEVKFRVVARDPHSGDHETMRAAVRQLRAAGAADPKVTYMPHVVAVECGQTRILNPQEQYQFDILMDEDPDDAGS